MALIGAIVHRKVAGGELEEDGSIRIDVADLDINGSRPDEAAFLDVQADIAATERRIEAGAGRWFGDHPDDEISW